MSFGGSWIAGFRLSKVLESGCWGSRQIGVQVRLKNAASHRLKQAAQKASKTLGEWCREVMLASTNGQPEKLNGIGGEAHAVMAEVVALRAILLNILFKQAKG